MVCSCDRQRFEGTHCNARVSKQKEASEVSIRRSNGQKMRVTKGHLKGMNCRRLTMPCLQNGYKRRRFCISYQLHTLNIPLLPCDTPNSFALSKPLPWATTTLTSPPALHRLNPPALPSPGQKGLSFSLLSSAFPPITSYLFQSVMLQPDTEM